VNVRRAWNSSLTSLVLLSVGVSGCGDQQSSTPGEAAGEVAAPAPHPEEEPMPDIGPGEVGDEKGADPPPVKDRPGQVHEDPEPQPGEIGESPATIGAPGEASGGNGGKESDATDERIVVVGGPTLNNDYPEYWGNLYLGDQCAIFTVASDYEVRLESVTVGEPLILVTDCAPDWEEEEEVTSRGCEPGIVLTSGSEASCILGVQLPTDGLDADFTPKNAWTFSVLCADTRAPPCSEVDVAEQHLLSGEGMRVYWTVEYPMRWCGASDYGPLTEEGEAYGPGDSPAHGCVEPSSTTN
jgi:hypothetical protein